MKIVFMGTPDFAKDSLEAIHKKGHNIIAVVTNPDRPSGRGMKMSKSPVKEYAEENKFLIFQPEKIRKNIDFIEQIKSLNPDIICVVAYGKILPKEIIDIPSKGCINVHGSLLPKYRGAAPIQWAVINGEKTTGVTTMFMDEGMDTGDIILKREIEIGPDETTGDVWNKLSKIGAELLVKTLDKIEDGTAIRVHQTGEFSMAPMIDKQRDTKINWDNKSAIEIKNLVRGLNPIMGAFTIYNGKKIKIWKAQVECELDENQMEFIREKENKYKNAANGTVILSDSKRGLFVKTKQGILSIVEIQGENAKKMCIEDFLRGNNINEGEVFE